MKQYLPNADLNNSNYAAGYHYATLLIGAEGLQGRFSRDNIMKQAASLSEVPLPLLLPGMTVRPMPTTICRSSNLDFAASTARAGSASAKFWMTASQARRGEQRTSIISGERAISYPEIHARIARAATGFKALGLGEGTPVAMMLRNDFALFEVSGAAAALGSPVVPINWHLKAEEVAYILADSGAEILVCHADLLPQIRDGLPRH